MLFVLIGLQTATAAGRLFARRATVADWFSLLVAAVFTWAVVQKGAATPSPDVATNVLIVVAAWSMIVVSAETTSRRDQDPRSGRR